MSNKNKKIAEDPMIQRQIQTEIWTIVLNHLASLAAAGREQELLMAGINTELLTILKSQTVLSLRSLSCDLTETGLLWDIGQLCRMIRLASVPKEAQELLLFGANNKVMSNYLRINAAKCKEWREVLEVESCFKARCVPDKIYKKVLDELNALCGVHTAMNIPIDALLILAQQHQVSLGAMWTELEKWDNKNEADK